MSNDYRNSEGYPDPTAGEAICRIAANEKQFLNDDDPSERELGLFFGNALMSRCAEVWVFGSRISSGMEAEIKRAKWKGYHLRYFTEECQEV